MDQIRITPLDEVLMDSLEQKIRHVVSRLDDSVRRVLQVKKWNGIPKAHSPATEEEIVEYEGYLGLRLPESYRAFLRLHNGYDCLAIFGNMISIQEAMPGGREHKYIREWKRDSAKYGGGEVLDAIVIAELGEPSQYVYFDPNKRLATNELAVIASDPESSIEYEGLIDFFEKTISTCEDIIQRNLEAGSRSSEDGE